MDPLSITGSIVAIIQLAGKIISSCKGYITSVKDAPRDLRTITIEVESVKSVAEVLQLLIDGKDGDSSGILEKLNGPNGPLEGCKVALKEIEKLFPNTQSNTTDRKLGKALLSSANLAWPFKENKARKLLEDIGCHKASITLALTTESAHDTKAIKSNVERLNDWLTDAERESVFKWLVVNDPSSMHNSACDLHEPQTGKWLIRSPEYQVWLGGPRRFLRLYGIPGSGKTILASFIIEEYKREKDEVPQFLRWVINQLCRQSKYIPTKVHAIHNDGGEPTIASLVAALTAVLGRFQRVYLVLDALDESSNRPRLLDMLIRIFSDNGFKKIKILTTSRKEFDIESALKDISVSISLDNHWVNEDIRLYIRNHLRNDRRLGRWPEELREEIEKALVGGVQGMFRWVSCQLDILGRLNSAADIRYSLTQLPKTLDETYERILANIPAESIKYAKRALHLLAFDLEITTLRSLAEAVIFDEARCTFIEDDRLLDPKDILEICTCLITYDIMGVFREDFNVRLAHYSVREYITSERIKATTFKTAEIAANVLVAKMFITYYLHFDYKPLLRYGISKLSQMSEDTWCDLELDHPLTAAAVNFDKFARMSGTDEVVCNLILKLLDPSQPHLEMWQNLYRLFYPSGEEFPIWKSPPGGELTTSLAYLCWFDLREAAISLLRTNMDPLILDTPLELQYVESWSVYMSELIPYSDRTLLQIAASLGREEFVEILLVKGANANAMPPHLPSAALSMVMDSEIKAGACQRMAATLLAAGADPNPPYARETPLQAAIYGRLSRKTIFEGEKSDVTEVVVMLLNAGADVNAIGSDEAMIAFIRHRSREKPDDSLDKLMRDRVNGFKYNSPLLILEKQLHFDRASWGSKPPSLEFREMVEELRALLIRHGARSFHAPPPGSGFSATDSSKPEGGQGQGHVAITDAPVEHGTAPHCPPPTYADPDAHGDKRTRTERHHGDREASKANTAPGDRPDHFHIHASKTPHTQPDHHAASQP